MSAVNGFAALLSRREAAQILGVREQTLGAWASLGRYDLPQVKVGRLSKYRREDLERFISARSTLTTEVND